MQPVILIILDEASLPLAWRTQRSLLRAGIDRRHLRLVYDSCKNETLPDPSVASVVEELKRSPGDVWLIRAGAWLVHDTPTFPPPAASGNLRFAFGVPKQPQERFSVETVWDRMWRDVLATNPGRLPNGFVRELPEKNWFSVVLDAELCAQWLACWDPRAPSLWSHVARCASFITHPIRWPGIDVHYDPHVRVAQVITSLQRGGAERIAIDLHRRLLHGHCTSRLVALGSPSREPFPTPSHTLELGFLKRRTEQLTALLNYLHRFQPDVVHAHLLNVRELAHLAEAERPLVATVHNSQPGWPDGMLNANPELVDLWIACSQAVEADLRRNQVSGSARTIWNGIDAGHVARHRADRTALRESLAEEFEFSKDSFLVLALANPRPQKRLERIPAVLRQLQDRLRESGDQRTVHLLIAGQAARHNTAAEASVRDLMQALETHAISAQTHVLGAVDEIGALLPAVDVLLSMSDFEGLSLAHLEALACGVPIVATAVGGAAEIGSPSDGVRLVPPSGNHDEFVDELLNVARGSSAGNPSIVTRDFEVDLMVDRYRLMYDRAIATKHRQAHKGIWLVCNNFSTGGAQSSARRLLLEMQRQGLMVGATVLQEDAFHPTYGSMVLRRAGIPVDVLPAAGTIDPLRAIEILLRRADRDPPRAMLLWNVIPEYKLLLADLMLDVPLIDVSPGEMNFSSLEQYFCRTPRRGLPYRRPTDYGLRLESAVVKFAAEKPRAEALLGIPVSVIPNGVPVPSCSQVRSVRDQATIRIGTAARLSPQKRLDMLIEAFRLALPDLPNARLVIAGGSDGGNRDYVEFLRRESSGLPVDWIGHVEDIAPFLCSLDLFVMISEPAGCPNASLEAMSVGLPVIATDAGGAAEQVIDQMTGLLVPRNDCAALAVAMTALAHDGATRVRFGRNGRTRIIEHFTVERMTADYRRLLQV